ncbi:hypothetical protein JOC27_002377 [Sporolactobacillus spathodeae]|uniref:PIN domain-containing protein n=1 Tax=Sporolactobacillus spathodeae TaxID=1465502 RepID=A0ABS2QCN7_9BACL|nr:hypothetical protein [Sporolactobacillus spathodeae]
MTRLFHPAFSLIPLCSAALYEKTESIGEFLKQQDSRGFFVPFSQRYVFGNLSQPFSDFDQNDFHVWLSAIREECQYILTSNENRFPQKIGIIERIHPKIFFRLWKMSERKKPQPPGLKPFAYIKIAFQ